MVAQRYGGPEVLAVVDEDLPELAPGQVRVDLRAIGVNPFDFKSYSGAFGDDPEKLPLSIGTEGAGVVAAVADEAVSPDGLLAVGTEVIVYPGTGMYAESVVVSATSVLVKPPSLAWEPAAGLLLTGVTAMDTLDTAATGPDDVVLVHGASGGVGSATVQLAVGRGATVVGTASADNLDYVRGLGAIAVPYGSGLADRVREAAPGPVTVAIDTAGTDEAVDVSVDLVADRSRIVTIAAGAHADDAGIVRVGGPQSAAARRAARQTVVELAGSGALSVRIARTFSLDDAATAHRDLAQPHPPGKFILLP
ncbi:NADPH:quinone reductase [Rhodococcus rhodnii LMG 5362]|uniref:NADPH:quinone reductase n=1 Tax=Rhodococcus rhodnii LMG 5362 TaxID=1273125 RepID=R7WTK4_9NOCA|nr:NADPH:quinone reductase [Rhodococcus rhodnii LMG 5362]